MFTNDLREANQEEVKMQDVDPDALEQLVQYMYTGNIKHLGFYIINVLCPSI
jgi:kelch-like protein 1/4/5